MEIASTGWGFNFRNALLTFALVGAALSLTFAATQAARAAGPESGETCFATLDEGATVVSSTDASAVQQAIDAATPGQIVKVAGYCPGAHIIVTKTLTLQGGYTTTDWLQTWPMTQPTTLDGSNSGRVMTVWGDITATLDGLIFMGGNPGYAVGGGLYTAAVSATVSHSQIVHNTASMAIGCADGFNGGGIYNAGQLIVADSQINSNLAGNGSADSFDCIPGKGGDGGGIYNAGSLAVFDSTFAENETGTGGTYVLHGPWGDNGSGGAIYSNGPLTVSGSLFWHNRTGWLPLGGIGGGIASISVTRIVNSAIGGNFATVVGNGLYLGADATLMQVTVADNVGGDGSGIYLDGAALLTNTLVVSQGVGVMIGGNAVARLNGVLWFGNGANVGGSSTVTVTHAYTGFPAFRDPAAADYHLAADSAAINRGVSSPVHFDLDGNPRDALPDLGAYEYSLPWKYYLAVALR